MTKTVPDEIQITTTFEFGSLKVGVGTLKFVNEPVHYAVLLTHLKVKGNDTLSGKDVEGNPLESKDGLTTVLTFPTKEQAQTVINSLTGTNIEIEEEKWLPFLSWGPARKHYAVEWNKWFAEEILVASKEINKDKE